MTSKKQDFPYSDYMGSELWRLIDKTITDLEKNNDIDLLTPKKYIVGYLCKKIVKSKLIEPKSTEE